MQLVTHDARSSEPCRSRLAAWLTPTLLALLGVTATGCDIVQGFQDAGDSLFPEQSTHLASPGLRILDGHYRELGLIAGSELYLVAREADDDTGKLFSMRYAEPSPCEIPGVGRFSATGSKTRSAPLISYFNDDTRRGKLQFADATCKTYPLTFEDARLPIGETGERVVIWDGGDVWLVAPEAGEQELVASDVSKFIRGVFGKRFALREHGRLTVLDSEWKRQGTFGDEVGSVLREGKSLFFTDAVGLHRIVASSSDSGGVQSELLLEDACSLGSQGGAWVGVRSPCQDGEVQLVHEPSGRIFTLPFAADPRSLRLVPARDSRGRDPLSDPFWFFYLKSGEDESTQDTLFVRTPDGAEHALGAHSTLAQLRLVDDEAEPYGYALVDVEGETGNYLWWNANGETKRLAERAMWRPDRLFVDFDGTVGSLAVAAGDSLGVLARDVPWQAFEYGDGTKAWTVLFHDMHEGVGRLSAISNGLDSLEGLPKAALEMPDLSAVASNVIVLSTSSLDEVLSGVIYLTEYDLKTRTGRLDYTSLDLHFSARVNEGVSDYLVAQDQVLYAIPYGDRAGIWLAAGK